MRNLRILALMHSDLVPPDDVDGLTQQQIDPFKMEWDVCSTLSDMGHEVIKLGVRDQLKPLQRALRHFQPHITFNLLEEFRGDGRLDWNVVAYLELMQQRYTGCNPRGLLLARDKALSKKILAHHGLRTPAFTVFPMGKSIHRPAHLRFPLFVKSLVEEASLGIAQASVVNSDEQLTRRVQFIHEHVGTDALVEEYIDGREIYVSLIGGARPLVLPPWELHFDWLPPGAPRIATARTKWDRAYQQEVGLSCCDAGFTPEQNARIARLSRKVYRELGLNGYARLDFRMDHEEKFHLLEANPNPQIAKNEDFADSAAAAGIGYPELLKRLLRFGLRRS